MMADSISKSKDTAFDAESIVNNPEIEKAWASKAVEHMEVHFNKWHKLCLQFADKVEDATYGTLVRIRSCNAYTEENTIFVVRLQFLAIEIARNREGLNNSVYENHRKEAS